MSKINEMESINFTPKDNVTTKMIFLSPSTLKFILNLKVSEFSPPLLTASSFGNQKPLWNNNKSNGMSSGLPKPEWLKPEMVFPRECIEFKGFLGCGGFGMVQRALIRYGPAAYQVAIKSAEIKHDRKTSPWNPYITPHGGNLCNYQEYCSSGNLKSYLINHRQNFKDSLECVKTSAIRKSRRDDINNLAQLEIWAYQIASGMEFLAQCSIYHGDLACRNVLLTDQLIVKISDFGLSKRLYSQLSTPLKDTAQPIKWVALEVLQLGEVTIMADVWSYGVVLWEIFELGTDPYSYAMDAHIVALTLRKDLEDGYRLNRPKHCPEHLCELMQHCWNAVPEKRPTFSSIKNLFENYYNFKYSNTDDQEEGIDELLTNVKHAPMNEIDLRRQSIISEAQIQYAQILHHKQSLQKQFDTLKVMNKNGYYEFSGSTGLSCDNSNGFNEPYSELNSTNNLKSVTKDTSTDTAASMKVFVTENRFLLLLSILGLILTCITIGSVFAVYNAKDPTEGDSEKETVTSMITKKTTKIRSAIGHRLKCYRCSPPTSNSPWIPLWNTNSLKSEMMSCPDSTGKNVTFCSELKFHFVTRPTPNECASSIVLSSNNVTLLQFAYEKRYNGKNMYTQMDRILHWAAKYKRWQISNYLQIKGNSSFTYLYNPECKEPCPENCVSSWKVWRGVTGKYIDYSLNLSKGNGIITIYKGCDTEGDQDLVQVLQSKPICYTTQISANCEVTCQSSIVLYCRKFMTDFSKTNGSFIDGYKIPGEPGRCKEATLQSCACKSDFCNNSSFDVY